MDIDRIWQFIMTAIGAGVSYILFILKRDRDQVDSLRNKDAVREKDIAVIQEQLKHSNEKQDYIVQMCEDLKDANKAILQALARRLK